MTRSVARPKQRIERELRRVDRFIAGLRLESRSEEMEGGGDNTPLSEVTDTARISENTEIEDRLAAWLARRSADFHDALLRIETGSYGTCTRCHRSIHRERLEALPEAALCLECQRLAERPAPAHPPHEGTRRI